MRISEKAQFISIKNQYRAAHNNVGASAQAMLAWAEKEGIYHLDERAARARDASKLSDALRTEYTTVNGQRTRMNHCYTAGQTEIWDSLPTISRDHMTLSLANRRRGITGEVKQMRRDELGWDKLHTDQRPIQLDIGFFSFVNDLADAGLASVSSSETELPLAPLHPGLADSEEQPELRRPSSPRESHASPLRGSSRTVRRVAESSDAPR